MGTRQGHISKIYTNKKYILPKKKKKYIYIYTHTHTIKPVVCQ